MTGPPTRPRFRRASAALEKGQYTTEAEAKTNCPSDAVVWVNSESKVYHASGSRNYGKTKTGAYMCEQVSVAARIPRPQACKARWDLIFA